MSNIFIFKIILNQQNRMFRFFFSVVIKMFFASFDLTVNYAQQDYAGGTRLNILLLYIFFQKHHKKCRHFIDP